MGLWLFLAFLIVELVVSSVYPPFFLAFLNVFALYLVFLIGYRIAVRVL